MTRMRKLLGGALPLFLSLCLPGCGSLLKVLKGPPEAPTVSEAACPRVPKTILEPTKIPEICFNVVTGDDYQACLEGIFGSKENPEHGALTSCNADKATVLKILDGELK